MNGLVEIWINGFARRVESCFIACDLRNMENTKFQVCTATLSIQQPCETPTLLC